MSQSITKRQNAVKQKFEPKARTPAGDAFSALIVQVMQLEGIVIAAGDALASCAGQTSARWQVLAAIENRPASVAHISRILGLTRQSVQRVANMLEEDLLAAFQDNPDHQRAKLLRLTAVGRATLTTIQEAQRPWANEIGAQIGEEELRRVAFGLKRVMTALTKTKLPEED